MKLLQIVSKVPYPLEDGSKILVNQSITHLDKNLKVTLISFYFHEHELSYKKELEKICEKVYFVRRYKNPWLPFINFTQKLPYTMMLYDSQEMRDTVKRIATTNSFDLLQVDHPHMAQYEKYVSKIPRILRFHNIESQILDRFSQYQKNPILRYYAKWQSAKLRQYESEIVNNFDHVLVISPADLHELKEINPHVNASVIPAGTDIPEPFSNLPPVKSNQLIYCGAMDWFPNLDAISYFSREILPGIVKKVPDVQLIVAGKNPKSRLLKNLHPNIKVLGWVDDIKPKLLESVATVIPLRYGGGIRLKILEAFALGLPVITTSIGCEGIDVIPGKHLLIGDTPEVFAQQTIRVLTDNQLRDKLICEGKNLVKDKYDWNHIGSKLSGLYRDIYEKSK